MDIFYFCNGITNIYNVLNKYNDELTYGDYMIMKDPLIILDFQDNIVIDAPINNNILYNLIGGGKKAGKPPSKTNTKTNTKSNVKSNSKSNSKTNDNGGKSNSNNISSELDEIESEKSPTEETETLKNSIKLFVKVIVFLFFFFMLPLLPWIYLSLYTFRKIKNEYSTKIISL
jgi:hypothetical protein